MNNLLKVLQIVATLGIPEIIRAIAEARRKKREQEHNQKNGNRANSNRTSKRNSCEDGEH